MFVFVHIGSYSGSTTAQLRNSGDHFYNRKGRERGVNPLNDNLEAMEHPQWFKRHNSTITKPSLCSVHVQVTFYKFNCNKANKKIGQALNIKVAPTFLIYKGQEEHTRLTGAKIPPLQAALDEAIP